MATKSLRQQVPQVKAEIATLPEFVPEFQVQLIGPDLDVSLVSAIIAKALKESGFNVRINEKQVSGRSPEDSQKVGLAYSEAKEASLDELIQKRMAWNNDRVKSMPGYKAGVRIDVDHLPWG